MPGQETAGGDEDNDPTEEATAEPARGYHEPLNFYEAEFGMKGLWRVLPIVNIWEQEFIEEPLLHSYIYIYISCGLM